MEGHAVQGHLHTYERMSQLPKATSSRGRSKQTFSSETGGNAQPQLRGVSESVQRHCRSRQVSSTVSDPQGLRRLVPHSEKRVPLHPSQLSTMQSTWTWCILTSLSSVKKSIALWWSHRRKQTILKRTLEASLPPNYGSTKEQSHSCTCFHSKFNSICHSSRHSSSSWGGYAEC